MGPESPEQQVEDLLLREWPRLAGYLRVLGAREEEIEDILSDSFLAVFRLMRQGEWAQVERPASYLFAVARNRFRVQRLVRFKAAAEALDDDLLEGIADPAAEQRLERVELREAVQDRMREVLTDREVQVMTLHYLHDVPLAKTAEMLAISYPTARVHLANARQKLVKAFKREDFFGDIR
ncbi:RNA polymerase sigma factor [Actinomadura soli]|uniref:RNA polymerase sigma factor n=1 Tax=Actinomadura soli TaxID=2508997 RepID=UPI0014862674|nr:sigma-70 family RNA polymerase sigma factor [Actinomadura soli]